MIPSDEIIDGLKVSVYGTSGSGKTRFAASFAEDGGGPLLLIGEDGVKSISIGKREKRTLDCGAVLYSLIPPPTKRGREIDFVKLGPSEQMDEFTELAKEYKSVALDHSGRLLDTIVKEVTNLSDVEYINRSYGTVKREDWMISGNQWKERVSRLLDLADRDGKNVVIIAHERTFGDDAGTSEVIAPKVGSALSPSVASWLDGAVDYICQTMIRQKVTETTDESTGTTITVATKDIEFCLRTKPHPVYKIKFRLPEGIDLPEVVVDPSYAKIARLIRGEKL